MTRPVKHNQFGRHAAVSMRRGAIAALDIGTNKVACLIAETAEDNAPNRMMRVTGFGRQISEGLQAGQITDMRAAETVCAPPWMLPSAWPALKCRALLSVCLEPDFEPDLRGACAVAWAGRQCRSHGAGFTSCLREILVGRP